MVQRIENLANTMLENFLHLATGGYREQLRVLLTDIATSGYTESQLITAELEKMRNRILTRLTQIQVGPNPPGPALLVAINEMLNMMGTFKTWLHPVVNGLDG